MGAYWLPAAVSLPVWHPRSCINEYQRCPLLKGMTGGAPVTGPVAFTGELKLSVNASGEGVISGRVTSSEDGTILTLAEDPVTGSYRVGPDCRGRATIWEWLGLTPCSLRLMDTKALIAATNIG